MKILIFLLLLPIVCFSQTTSSLYHIVKVDGNIINMNQEKSLTRGDKILATDNLKFKSSNANALAISENSEKFALKEPSIDVISENRETVSVMLSASPIVSRNQLSTRGLVDANKPIVDLKSYFGKENFAVIGDSLSVKLDDGIYPLNNNKYIVFYYDINGIIVSKKVGFNKQRLIIEKEKLMESKGNKLSGNEISNIEVYQHELSTDKTDLITSFNLVFIDKKELVKEFDTMLPVINKVFTDEKEKKEYLINYFGDIYGLTDLSALNNFVENYFNNLN